VLKSLSMSLCIFLFVFLGPGASLFLQDAGGVNLDYLNGDLVGSGAAFNLNWHAFPFLFLFSLRLVVLHYALADWKLIQLLTPQVVAW